MTLKEQILKLRNEGKTYSEIADLIHCSKGVISYHCNESVKANALANKNKWRKETTLKTKIRNFNHQNQYKRKLYPIVRNPNLTEKSLIEKFGPNPKCYISGIPINLDDPSAYSLDHIIPISKGGTNDISNCGLASKTANMIKSDLSIDELIEYCKLILNHNEKLVCPPGFEPGINKLCLPL